MMIFGDDIMTEFLNKHRNIVPCLIRGSIRTPRISQLDAQYYLIWRNSGDYMPDYVFTTFCVGIKVNIEVTPLSNPLVCVELDNRLELSGSDITNWHDDLFKDTILYLNIARKKEGIITVVGVKPPDINKYIIEDDYLNNVPKPTERTQAEVDLFNQRLIFMKMLRARQYKVGLPNYGIF